MGIYLIDVHFIGVYLTFLWSSARVNPNTVTVAETIVAETVPSPQNPYGQASSGWLTVKSKLLKATSRQFEIGCYDYFQTRNLLTVFGDDIGRADFDETVWAPVPFRCVPLLFVPEFDQLFGLIVMPVGSDLVNTFDTLSVSDGSTKETKCVRIGRFNSATPEAFKTADFRTIVVE
jgi:hypothetical protein